MRLSISYFLGFIFIITLLILTGCKEDNVSIDPTEPIEPIDVVDPIDAIDCDSVINENSNLLTEGLVAYYPFNNSINDESGFANTGDTTSIIPTVDRNMKCDGAYYFNGDDSGIIIPDNEQLSFESSFTVSVWFNADIKTTQQIIGQKFWLDGRFRWPFALSVSGSNDFIFSIATNEGYNTAQARKTGYSVDTWYMMTGVYENSKIYLYIDGMLAAEKEIEGEFFDSDLDLYIGRSPSEDYNRFKGIIDDVRIYNRALSQNEITLLYNN